MARTRGTSGFKMRSGNSTSFKKMGSAHKKYEGPELKGDPVAANQTPYAKADPALTKMPEGDVKSFMTKKKGPYYSRYFSSSAFKEDDEPDTPDVPDTPEPEVEDTPEPEVEDTPEPEVEDAPPPEEDAPPPESTNEPAQEDTGDEKASGNVSFDMPEETRAAVDDYMEDKGISSEDIEAAQAKTETEQIDESRMSDAEKMDEQYKKSQEELDSDDYTLAGPQSEVYGKGREGVDAAIASDAPGAPTDSKLLAEIRDGDSYDPDRRNAAEGHGTRVDYYGGQEGSGDYLIKRSNRNTAEQRRVDNPTAVTGYNQSRPIQNLGGSYSTTEQPIMAEFGAANPVSGQNRDTGQLERQNIKSAGQFDDPEATNETIGAAGGFEESELARIGGYRDDAGNLRMLGESDLKGGSYAPDLRQELTGRDTIKRETVDQLGGEHVEKYQETKGGDTKRTQREKNTLNIKRDKVKDTDAGFVRKTGEGFLGLQNRKKYVDGVEVGGSEARKQRRENRRDTRQQKRSADPRRQPLIKRKR